MDVITAAYKVLEPITERGVKVQEGWYDEHYKRLHVTLWPLAETPEAHSDDALEIETAGLQVTIFSHRGTRSPAGRNQTAANQRRGLLPGNRPAADPDRGGRLYPPATFSLL